MATWDFTPKTYDGDRIAGPEQAPHDSVWRFFPQLPVGYHVLITDGTVTPSPGTKSVSSKDIANADSGSGEGGKAWYRGGLTYRMESAEKDLIDTDEGYSGTDSNTGKAVWVLVSGGGE